MQRSFHQKKSFFRRCLILTAFHREYSKFFSKRILTEAEYICQQDVYYKETFKSNADLLAEAERLVKKYAKATLVVTSRIHCALPCLGLETPVLYTEDGGQSEASACRLGGLRELLHVMHWEDGTLKPYFHLKNIIDGPCDVPPNKDLWKPLADVLKTTCLNFCNNQSAMHKVFDKA